MAETFDPHCVWFVGAGPGDRELITLKGYRLLQQAQVVIYAGSLINTELLAYCPPQAECHDSAALHLEQILDLMEAGVKAGKTVVRLQTGDVSLYGSVREQGEELTRRGLDVCSGTCCYQFDRYASFDDFRAPVDALCKRLTAFGAKYLVAMDESDVGL